MQFEVLCMLCSSVVLKQQTKRPHHASSGHSQEVKNNGNYTGLLIFRGKKSKISRDFQGQIRGKIG